MSGNKTNNDYVAANDYNELVDEISNAKNSRGLGTGTASKVSKGQEITQAHLTNLQDTTKNTIRYGSKTEYNFAAPSSSGPPLASLYNQVREVVVDLNTNQRCVACSSSCRETCSYNCYTPCGSGCSSVCTGCSEGCENACGSNCVNACQNSCSNACSTSCTSVLVITTAPQPVTSCVRGHMETPVPQLVPEPVSQPAEQVTAAIVVNQDVPEIALLPVPLPVTTIAVAQDVKIAIVAETVTAPALIAVLPVAAEAVKMPVREVAKQTPQ